MMDSSNQLKMELLELVRDIQEELTYQISMGVNEIELDLPPPSQTEKPSSLAAIREEIGDCKR